MIVKLFVIALLVTTTDIAPKPSVNVGYDKDHNAISFQASCPKGWQAHISKEDTQAYNDLAQRDYSDAIKLLTEKVTCVRRTIGSHKAHE